LYVLPEGYKAPTSNTSGRTWTEWFAGRKGDAFDQSINGISGFASGIDFGLSSLIRRNNPLFEDRVDYESPMFVGGEIVGTVSSAFVNPTGIAAKGTAIYNLYNKFDDAGRCANLATKVVHGGCFVEGTLVTVSSLPGQSTSTDSLWSNPSWLDEPYQETPWLAPERYASVATRTQLQVPIESVPIGSRVPTKNPNRFEVAQQPDPDQATWAKLSITVERSDGGIVDAEIIRPRSWILRNGICAGRMLPLNLPELEVSGLALVTAIDDCPPIAGGEGSVVTARFVTREVHVVASVDVLGADGTVETITGTTIHPVWSVDRQSWVPLAELTDGETLQGLDGLAVVLSVALSRVSQPVYNIEVHGEHVYQVGELGLVVHNVSSITGWGAFGWGTKLKAPVKPVSLPSMKKLTIDIDHIASGHMKGGSRVSPIKDLFPETWTKSQVEKAIKEAYKSAKRIHTQGDRILVQGTYQGKTIEMWINKVTKTIETAYPKGW
jgi:hypothetical protein